MGEKKWNPEKGKWQIEGEPDQDPVYKVTWRSEGGKQHSMGFPNADQGYTFYQQMKKTAGAYTVRWIAD